MQIVEYEYRDLNDAGWNFERLEFGNLNLLVGDSGMGKTRLLNTIFNLGASVASDRRIGSGHWRLLLREGDYDYIWTLETQYHSEKRQQVLFERLQRNAANEESNIIQRSLEQFTFMDKELPKLPPDSLSLTLLREEEVIQPLYRGFASIVRRNFFGPVLGEMCGYQVISPDLAERIHRESRSAPLADMVSTFKSEDLKLNVVLDVLSKAYKDIFEEICSIFIDVFPFIEDAQIKELRSVRPSSPWVGYSPVFCIKEKGVDDWITLADLSSGMQKVLLIVTDILILPDGSIYFIDEYENSLGVSAIDFFPTFLYEHHSRMQVFITSHHPYIINKIPVENWFVLHRKGSTVRVKYGNELVNRLGKSKQQAFIKLLNDPFYIDGEE